MVRPLHPIALAALLLAGCAAPPAADVGLTLLARAGQSALYRAGHQRLLVLRGTPHQMGLDHGRLLGPEVKTVITEGLVWTHGKGLSREALGRIHAASWPHVPERYKEEMRGLSEASGVPLQELQLLHAMPSKFHCSGAAAAGPATADGALYHTRSLDYSLDIGVDSRIQNHALLIVRDPTDGLATAVPAWAGFLGAVTGLNLAGISIGEMGSASRDESFEGLPMIFMVREALLRARTLDEALDVFRRGPRTCGFNFILGSGDERKAVALEVTRSEVFVSGFGDPAENVPPHTALPDMVRRTNHFVGENTAATQRRPGQGYDPGTYMKGSWQRYQQITRYLQEHRGALDGPTMIALLRLYPPKHPCLHQAVMNASARVLWVSQAVDDRTSETAGAQNQPFVRYDLGRVVRMR